MSAEEETFILLVQKYKELYDMSDKNYSNLEVRDNCWTEISEIMHITVLECKEKWKKLRDCFRKAVKNRKMKSGAAAKKVRPWKLEQQMAFLLPHIEERTQVSNVPSPASQTTEELGNNVYSEDIIEVYSQNSTMADISASTETTPEEPEPGRRRKKPKVFAADVLSKYLEEKERKKIKTPNDSLGNFFLSIADTVRNLPSDLQISVKTDIFKTVTAAELVALQRSQGASSISSGSSTFLNSFQSQDSIYTASYETHPRESHSIYPGQSHYQEPHPSYRPQFRDSSYKIMRLSTPGPSFRSPTPQYNQQFHEPSQNSETLLTPLPSPEDSVVSPNQPSCHYPTELAQDNNTPEFSKSTQ